MIRVGRLARVAMIVGQVLIVGLLLTVVTWAFVMVITQDHSARPTCAVEHDPPCMEGP